ncbi:GIY-YIG nuclease family protein [Mucilaginibacter aquaedulcis]|uniref:GIY-YIG nuclease family protein n=1 Tax=Mucilaginibacter aquaedulcis TaxID=1187081 RepID=UPI0025B567C5|nr:GIY-YIG nuclease family protein [Mucilaginibacter aquaedulcis]MDN3550503.1 GIY-YIG nuclease family protein [Mucilaginibacter aquaedulcis]
MNEEVDDLFYQCCFRLFREDIEAFNAADNGPINNVMAGIDKHCLGVNLEKDIKGLIVSMFFIDGQKELKGDLIELRIADPNYYGLLLRFCVLIARDYEEIEPVDAFNTYQKKLRGFLEKDGYFTVTNFELEPFAGKDAVMFAPTQKGIIKVEFIDKVIFYRDFFQNNHQTSSEGSSFVYLMINTDTSCFKIGFSKNPAYRERTLHSKEPCVHLVAKWPCPNTVEKELHQLYKAKRVRGEWFNLNFKDLTEIEQFMNNLVAQ